MSLPCINILLTAAILLATAQSSSVHKRSDDSDPLGPVVDRLVSEVTELKARVDAMNHKVAFTAQFSSDHPSIRSSGPFKFDHVVLNDGNAYDPQLGIFTAPFPGVYTFSLQIFTYGTQRPLVDIRVNGQTAHRMALDTNGLGGSHNGEDSDSMTVVLKLAQGDRVWVESYYTHETFWGGFHTFFTGSLVYAV